MQDLIIIAQGFGKIFFNFAPIVLLMTAVLWVTLKAKDLF